MAINDVLLRLRLQGQQGVQAGLQQTSRVGVASFAGIVTAGVAATKMLFEMGEAFDNAYDTVRVKTGATGATFAGLQDDVRAIARVVPSGLGDIGEAVAGINSRLELTGAPLRSLAADFLNLSRITGTDVETNIQAVTRALGDWDIAQSEQSDTLNKFFRASQASGASVSDLAEQVVQFGAPLRQFGFGIDQAIAMFAMFEEAGVNTQTMMPGLKFALKSFYAAGKDPGRALIETFRGIRDGTISTSGALKIFGQRAGADMVEAIRQGRFELDDLTAALQHGDTIQKASDDTADFTEAWQIFKNQAMLTLEPVATRVFNLLSGGLKALPPYIRPVADGFASVYHWVQRNDDAVVAAAAGLGTYIALTKGYAAWSAVAAFATGGWVTAFWALDAAMSANPVGLVILGIAALTAAIVYAYRKSSTFRDVVQAVGHVLRYVLGGALRLIIWEFTTLAGAVSTTLSLLGHVPGFGWAKDAARDIDRARDAMTRFGEVVQGTHGKPARVVPRRGAAPARRGPRALLPIPGMAAGGAVAWPGRFVVGEDGPEVLDLPGRAVVHPAGAAPSSMTAELGALIAAIHRLAARPVSVQLNGREIARANSLQLADEKAFA